MERGFTARNSTTFNAARLYHGVRYRFHEKFICLHGDSRHKGVKKTYTGCSVKMDIKIKLITKNTIRIDKDVRTHPCTITIEGTHNHPTKAPSALQELRIPTATTDTFFKYFDLGMTVPQAIRFHREKLNFNLSDLANAAVNPKPRSVYYMREKWLKNNYGTLGGRDNKKFEESTDSDDDDCKTSNPKRRSKQIMEKLDILTETVKHSAALYGDELTVGDIEKLTNRFRNVVPQISYTVFSNALGGFAMRRKGKIPGQPTSIARRQQGMPRGAAPITKRQKEEREPDSQNTEKTA
ncbi:uncharacterized protein [Macrobrachium rosenbergii]|uniref:uncharacterized protein n=1 Tax=Macrobrachium rosenbergii TaxID=79674 RepID=UPI0034D58B09